MAAPWTVSNQFIADWCDGVPILGLLPDTADAVEDVLARVTDASQLVTVKGVDLGDKQGKLRLGQDEGKALQIKDILSWSDKSIQFHLGEQCSTLVFKDAGFPQEPKSRVIYAFVGRAAAQDDLASARKSVGRFAVVDQGPEVVQVKITQAAVPKIEYLRLNTDAGREPV